MTTGKCIWTEQYLPVRPEGEPERPEGEPDRDAYARAP
jgi:hypothetical protein